MMSRSTYLQRNRAMALPMVLIVVVIIGVAVGGLYFLMQTGLRRTVHVQQMTEHMYLGEAILAKIVNQLKKAPWDLRYYAEGKSAPASEIENGSYRGADYVAIIEDVVVRGSSQVIPDVTDVLLRVNYRDITRNFFARVTIDAPTVLQPTSVNVERLYPTNKDVTSAAVRSVLSLEATSSAVAAAKACAEADVIARVSQDLQRQGKTLYEIQQTITSAGLDGAIEQERNLQEHWRLGFVNSSSDGAGKYAASYDEFKQAYDLAKAQEPVHEKYNAPRSLFYMARARMGEYEEKMLAVTDPLVPPASDPLVKAVLEEAIGHFDTIVTNYPDSEDAPYALLNKAKCQQRLGDATGATKTLDDLLKDYPDVHLWGEDQTVAGKGAKDGIVAFEKALLDPEGEFFLSADERSDGVPQIYFVDEDGAKIRVTNDARPKDMVTPSPDGSRVAYRAKNADGSYRAVVVDRDGNNPADVTWSQGDWRPAWTAEIASFEFEPVLLESIPSVLDSTGALDLSSLPNINSPCSTLAELYASAQTLYATLVASPYSVDPKNLREEERAIKRGGKDIENGQGDKPGKIKKHFNARAINRLVEAIRCMERIKALIDEGDTSWQSEIPQSDPPPGGGHHHHHHHGHHSHYHHCH